MDSITQFALGAAIGEFVAGRKSGYRGWLWGGIAGTIPDLDVVLSPWLTDLQKLSVHRGISHSLVFPIFIAPLLAWLAWRLHRSKSQAGYNTWLQVFFWAIFTHPLLDSLTLYGTQLFLPFSDYRVALNTISIVDPLYTLPLIVCTVRSASLRKTGANERSVRMVRLGLILSSAYLVLTAANKFQVDRRFEQAFTQQGIQPNDWLTNPVLFSNLLWYTVTVEDSVCRIGYLSVLRPDDPIRFETFPRQTELESRIDDTAGLERLKRFSKGFYVMEEQQSGLGFYDIRFGKTDLDNRSGNEQAFVFYFKIPEPGQRPLIIQQTIARADTDFGALFGQIHHRIFYGSPITH